MMALWLLRGGLALAILFFHPACATAAGWQQNEQGAARLIAGASMPGQPFHAGIHLRMAPGWHTYWRSPGDAGLPPQPDWSPSANLESATLLYPLPELFSLQGLMTYGYEGELVFPLRIEKTDPAQPLRLAAKLTILACANLCVPVDYNLALDIPNDYIPPPEDDAALRKFLARVPKKDDSAGLSIASAELATRDGKPVLRLDYVSPAPLMMAEVIAEPGDGSVLPVSRLRINGPVIEATLGPDALVEGLPGKNITVTLVDKTTSRAVEKSLSLGGAAAAPQEATPVERPGLGAMILLALLGGLILNLMPCVLPVIALKAVTFASHGGGTPKGVRLSFLSTSAGILFSFLVLAVAVMGMRQAGMSVGWGMQFQSPLFLIFLVTVLILFSANLWGFFEIALPRFLADRLSWTEGHGNLARDFLSGAFAALLATPCSAPFLGTAVGFALTSGAAEILAIFAALGTGLAAPFLVIAMAPRAATLLPKPGKWMVTLKKTLAVLLLLVAAWLGWILAMTFTPPSMAHDQSRWHMFDEAQIPKLVAEGKTVFVDVTAAWCLTCQANEKFVLSRPSVRKAFSADRVVLMRADWTRRSDVITGYLRRHGRYGIPFNVVYGPSAKEGIKLPEILTPGLVENALRRAK